ncbi:TPA: hypothetical protein ACTYJI_004873, partial [Enterobacter roggenkampii]
MSTITREFTKERLIEHAKYGVERYTKAVAGFPRHIDVAMDLELARIALASLELERGMIRRLDLDMSNCDSCGQDCGADMVEDLDGEYVLWDEVLPHLYRYDEYTAPTAPANAEPVAWVWSHRKHPSEVTLVRPEDDERAEGAHWSGWNCQALYAAPPASVSVPDNVSGPLAHAYKELTPTFMRNHIGVFERYGIYPDGSAGIQAMRIALDGMNRRADMLQGAEPVTTTYKLPANTPCKEAPEHIWLQTSGVWT